MVGCMPLQKLLVSPAKQAAAFKGLVVADYETRHSYARQLFFHGSPKSLVDSLGVATGVGLSVMLGMPVRRDTIARLEKRLVASDLVSLHTDPARFEEASTKAHRLITSIGVWAAELGRDRGIEAAAILTNK